MNEYTNFYNPYHFVRLGGNVNRSEDMLEARNNLQFDKVYTGEIEVELKTRTPLFIPDLLDDAEKEKEHKRYRFYSYDGKTPVIPGSSLRGILRSNYETISNSCLSVVDLDERPVRRTSEVYKPALLGMDKEGQIVLYEALKAIVKHRNRPDYNSRISYEERKLFKEGTPVQCKKPYKKGIQTVTENVGLYNPNQEKQSGAIKGYYFKGEPGVKKMYDSLNAYVFYFEDSEHKKPLRRDIKADGEEIKALKAVLKSYKENTENVRTKGYQGYKEYTERLEQFLGKRLEYFPVHYSVVGGKLYLSPASITKEVYYTTAMDILKAQGGHDTCKNFKKLCPACQLFGMVGDSKATDDKVYPNAWASSVRVTDACLKESFNEKVYKNEVRLMELASPKQSSTEFYLRRPPVVKKGEVVVSWTYDYYVTAKENNMTKSEIVPYIAQLSGRKYYWHHQEPNLPEKKYVKDTNRNCTVTPVREKVAFGFKVRFEKVTKSQLDQLIWLCNISSYEKDGKYGYKLGKGKPLGMGSVELRVTDVKIRSLKNADGNIGYSMADYQCMFGSDYNDIIYESAENESKVGYAGFDKDVKASFLRMCDFESTKGTPITYPVADGQSVKQAEEGYKWFMNNHYNKKGGNGRITKRDELVFQQHMKPLTDKNDVTLKVNRGNRGGDAKMHLDKDNANANDLLHEVTADTKNGNTGNKAGNRPNNRPNNRKSGFDNHRKGNTWMKK